MNPEPIDISSHVIKKVGYVADQKGIIKRFIDQGENWKTHLEETKSYIIQYAGKVKCKQTVVVLGSGWLLDVPLDYLADKFQEVYLVDINHPPQIIHKIRNYQNVKLLCLDVTGGCIDAVYNFVLQRKKNATEIRLTDIKCSGIPLPGSTDLVVSVNILSQLHALPVDYLKKIKDISSDEIHAFKKMLQQTHVDLLKKYCSLLITDTEEVFTDKFNKVVKKKSVVNIELPKGTGYRQWVWDFDNNRSYHPKYNTRMNVAAMFYC